MMRLPTEINIHSFGKEASGKRGLARQLLLWFLYSLVLCACYQGYVARLWKYQGFQSDLSFFKLGISIFVLILFVGLAPTVRHVPKLCATLIFGFVLIPTLILFSYNNLPWKYIGVTTVGMAVLLLVASLWPVRVVRMPKIAPAILVRALVLVAILNFGAILYFSGFSHVNFDLFRVYEFREDARGSLPGVFGYINAFTVRAALPFILILGLQQRNFAYVSLAIGLSIAFFAFTANRLPLFQPFLLIGIYYLLGRKNYLHWMALGFLVIAVLGLVSFILSPAGVAPALATLAIYRGIFVPMWVNWQYMDYFGSFGDFYYWANSKLTMGLIDAPDRLPMINVIGAEYWSGENVAANVGWLGSGYGNAGLIGVLVYSVLFGIILALIEGYVRKHGHRLAISLLVLPILVGLTTADFATLFLSQGLFASLLMLMIIKLDRVK